MNPSSTPFNLNTILFCSATQTRGVCPTLTMRLDQSPAAQLCYYSMHLILKWSSSWTKHRLHNFNMVNRNKDGRRSVTINIWWQSNIQKNYVRKVISFSNFLSPEQESEIHQGSSCPPRQTDQYSTHQSLQPVVVYVLVRRNKKENNEIVLQNSSIFLQPCNTNRNTNLKNSVKLMGRVVVEEQRQPRGYLSNWVPVTRRQSWHIMAVDDIRQKNKSWWR